jgi:hypothetical protein
MLDHAGTNSSAMAWCTSTVSKALQTLGRCVLALWITFKAACLVGTLIHKQVADADPAGHHRDAAVLTAKTVQALPAARDEHIHIIPHLDQFKQHRPIGGVDKLDGIRRESSRPQALAE